MALKEGNVETIEDRRQSIVEAPNESTELTIWQTVKVNPKVIAYSVALTVGPLIYGFDNIIVGLVTAMPAFQASFGSMYGGKLILPALWLSLWNALLQVGAMIGSLANGPLADRFGRRIAFSIGGLIGCIAVAILYVSDHGSSVEHRRGVFLGGKIILGLSLGILNTTCQTYISEIAPPRLRGPLLSIFTFFLVLGQLIAIVIVFARVAILDPSAYRVCFAAQWSFAGMAVIVGILIPESPSYLVKRGEITKAERSYARLHSQAQAPTAIMALKQTIEAENEIAAFEAQSSYLECFKGSNWRRTRIIAYANALQQCLGVTLLSNSAYFLQLGGMSPSNSIMVTEIGIGLGLPANVISWFIMTIFGRRPILMASTSIVGTIWLAIGIAGCFPSSSTALWFIGIGMSVILFFYNCGVGGIYPVVGAETSSVRLRAKSSGIGFMVNAFFSWLFNFVVPYMFDADEANLGGKMGFFFFGLCVIGLVVVFLEVPEMKNKTYAELDELFEARVPTRKFKTYQTIASTGNRTASHVSGMEEM